MLRNLCLVLGDQLDRESTLFDAFDPQQDMIWMAEVAEESEHVWSHKQRIVLFLSAMRHFASSCESRGFPVDYLHLGSHHFATLGEALENTLKELSPSQVRLVRPGDQRCLISITEVCQRQGIPLVKLKDRHFLSTPGEFREWAGQRQQLRMEYWYRHLRKRYDILLEDGKPRGGKWNYDASNRRSFSKDGPPALPQTRLFEPDSITRKVIQQVEQQFSDHPGSLEHFNWPVTQQQAQTALDHFIKERLESFGTFQDAMWQGEPFLYHSLLSSSLNLKLLHPLKAIQAVQNACLNKRAPLASAEGFIRQVLGWREYVRGLYWHKMPHWLSMNALDARHDLPAFYWDGETQMQCLHEVITQTLQTGYAHHIQRLMVTGLFALLYGVDPQQVHRWYLAVYVDAVEWVELPNTIGMSQYADGGLMASKPYIASGNYINKMSNYCRHCRYKPAQASGPDACPITTLFWDFLARHENRFENHPRMSFMLKNLQRKSGEERRAIQHSAEILRRQPE